MVNGKEVQGWISLKDEGILEQENWLELTNIVLCSEEKCCNEWS